MLERGKCSLFWWAICRSRCRVFIASLIANLCPPAGQAALDFAACLSYWQDQKKAKGASREGGENVILSQDHLERKHEANCGRMCSTAVDSHALGAGLVRSGGPLRLELCGMHDVSADDDSQTAQVPF